MSTKVVYLRPAEKLQPCNQTYDFRFNFKHYAENQIFRWEDRGLLFLMKMKDIFLKQKVSEVLKIIYIRGRKLQQPQQILPTCLNTIFGKC